MEFDCAVKLPAQAPTLLCLGSNWLFLKPPRTWSKGTVRDRVSSSRMVWMQPPYSTGHTWVVLQKLLRNDPGHVMCWYSCGLGCPIPTPMIRGLWAWIQPLLCSQQAWSIQRQSMQEVKLMRVHQRILDVLAVRMMLPPSRSRSLVVGSCLIVFL